MDANNLLNNESEAAVQESTDSNNTCVSNEEKSELGDNFIDDNTKELLLLFQHFAREYKEAEMKCPDSTATVNIEEKLAATILDMSVLAHIPHTYSLIVKLDIIKPLVELLLHKNTKILLSVIKLLFSLLHIDIVCDVSEAVDIFLNELAATPVCSRLVDYLLNSKVAATDPVPGLYQIFCILTNFSMAREHVCPVVCEYNLLRWMLHRANMHKSFTEDNIHIAEMIFYLLECNVTNRRCLGYMGGIEILLEIVASYRGCEPDSLMEAEMIKNFFKCLTFALVNIANRDRFLSEEGLELMILMLREGKICRTEALRVICQAMSGIRGKESCNKFVEMLGLRILFKLFMKPVPIADVIFTAVQSYETYIIKIILSMLQNCRHAQRESLINKFIEKNHKKVDRLMELHFKYLEKVGLLEEELEKFDPDEKHFADGFSTLQFIDYLILELCTTGYPGIKERVTYILNVRGSSKKIIRYTMEKYAENVSDQGNLEWRDEEMEHILFLIEEF